MKDLLIKLLRIELCSLEPRDILCGDEVARLSDTETQVKLYKLAAAHDLQHIVGAALYRLGINYGSRICNAYKNAQISAAYRYTGRVYALNELSDFFAELGIRYIPLKGAMIASYYPLPEMRTSCDIDILIKREQLDEVSQALTEKLSYQKIHSSGHDVQFVSPLGVHLELHFTLTEGKDTSPASEILDRVWEVALPSAEHPCRMEMPFHFAYFYHIAHMVKHFLYGGCGIRTIMDLHIIRTRALPLDKDAAQELIDRGGYTAFERAMRQLAEEWFSGAPRDLEDPATLAEAENYILNGGIYGNTENRVKMGRAEKKSRFRYLLSRIFLPYDHIKYDYPVLIKHPVLLPFCQVCRWFRLFKKGTSRRIAGELKIDRSITEEGQISTREMLNRLGLT